MKQPRVSSSSRLWVLAAGRRLNGLCASRTFRESAGNALYSIAEYIALPVSMVVAAPFLVRELGLPQYGIWMLVSAILGSVGILSTGFGDATVKYASTYRAKNDWTGVERTIRATLTINILLGTLFAVLMAWAAPYAVHNIFKIEPEFYTVTITAIRISAVILILRSVESVFVSTLRAFERYGPPVKLNVFLRAIVVITAVVLAALGKGVVAIMWGTLFWSALVVVMQARAARRVAGPFNVFPTLQLGALREVFSFGCFSWLQALAGVTFSYADRFLVAAMMGTAPVGVYVLCVQVTQPIHGLASAAFNFVFPHLSLRHEAGEVHGPRRVFRLAMFANFVVTALVTVPFVCFGRPLLRLWIGPQFAEQAHVVLAVLAIGFAILAINVVPYYTLLAWGQVRFVSLVNLAGGVLSLACAVTLIPLFGLTGAALGRIIYGPVVSLSFFKLARFSRRSLPTEALQIS